MTLHVAIDSVEYGEVDRASLRITEVLGAAWTASFVLEDMASALASAWYVDKKRADVRIWDTVDTGDLFRGQVTNIRASIEGVRRVLEIDAESYDGLLDYTLVGHDVHEYADTSHLTIADWLAAASSGTPLDVPTAWMDVSANTGIALPAVDDASVVQAFFTKYWRGPTLTYDIVSHCDVDSGSAIDIFSPDESDRRTFFGLTNLRDVLGQIASLVSPNLAFWIDADLVFHWRVVAPVVSGSTTAAPTGDVLTRLARMLPVPRDYVFSPYVASIDSTSEPFGTLRMEIPLSGVVDGVYVQGGTTQASGLVDFGTTYGAQAYVSAPWARLAGDANTAADYARDEYNGTGRLTITYETAADWHDIHVGQGLTLYHPAVGIGSATAYIIRQADIAFLPDNVRRYTLQLGDARLRTMTAYGSRIKDPKRKNAPESVPWPDKFGIDMGWLWKVEMTDVAPAPGSSQGVWVQYTDQTGKPVPIDGLKITWGLDIALGSDPLGSDGNRTPTRYTGGDATSSSLMFYLTYPTSVTAGGGRATNILTTNANASADDSVVVWVAYQ